MRNIPVFTTESGVASLILEAVAAKKEAYVRIQSSLDPEKLLQECKEFCIACGAERIFATGHDILGSYLLHTAVIEMKAPRNAVGETDASLFPMQEETMMLWRRVYNEGMAQVDNAAWLSESEMKKILKEGSAYFVHRDRELLGIGRASAGRIDAVVSLVRGAGADVVRALCHALSDDTVTIEVASTNSRAIALYQRLGFVPTRKVSKWFQIF